MRARTLEGCFPVEGLSRYWPDVPEGPAQAAPEPAGARPCRAQSPFTSTPAAPLVRFDHAAGDHRPLGRARTHRSELFLEAVGQRRSRESRGFERR